MLSSTFGTKLGITPVIKRRALFGTLCLISVLMGTVLKPAIPAAAADPDAVVIVGQANLRATPSVQAVIVAVLLQNTTLTLDGRDSTSSWLHGLASTGAGGWISRPLVQLRATLNVATLAVITPPPTANTVGNAAPIVHGGIGGGFALGGQVQGLSSSTVNAMHTAGMTWVKQQAHVGDGGAAGLIGTAHADGFKILLSVVGDKNSLPDDGYQTVFASYVGGLAAAGADAIEVGNEENIDREWRHGAISPVSYVSLLAKSFNAIKSANRNTIVISGALAPTGAEGAFGLESVWNDDHYYAGMAAAGAGKYTDCIGVHYNEGIVSPLQTSGDPRGDNYPTRYFSTMLRRAIGPFPGKKACFTELGYLTPQGYGPLPGSFGWAANTTAAEQATWITQAAVRASNSGLVRLMIIFNVDFTYYGSDPQAGYAIIRPGGVCTACTMLGAVIH